MLFNAYAPSSYFVFTHHSQDFHYNTFTFFIISLSFLSMFYNTKLRAFVFCCILMRSKYTLKGQILDAGQEFAPFYEKEVSEAQFNGTRFRSWV